MRFVRFDPEGKVNGDGVPVNDVSDHILDGLTVGRRYAYQSGQIGAIAAEGYGLSFYADIASIIRALLIREVYDQTVLDENSDPLLWQPTGSFDPQHQSDPISRKDGIRIVRGLREDDQPPEYVQQQLEGTVISRQTATELLEQMHRLAGVPTNAFGNEVAKNTTGAAQEHLLFTAHARIERARLHFEKIMRAIIALIPGAPAGNISLDWTEDPFISKTVRRAQALD